MKMLKNTMKKIQNWWQNCDFILMEEITGFKQTDFNPEDGYQEFVDACDEWWREKPISEKIKIYKEFN